MTKIYTKSGDQGKTGLLGGTRVSKSDLRLEAYGTLDELNSQLGMLVAMAPEALKGQEPELFSELAHIQSDLFTLGSRLACETDAMRIKLASLNPERTVKLEQNIDRMTSQLPELQNFVLPGGTVLSSQTHIARTVCRRAERICASLTEPLEPETQKYINRLSDYLFVLARYFNYFAGCPEQIWKP